jgi:zinc protease
MNTPTIEHPPYPTHEFTLDNGLRIVVREDHRTPQVALTLKFASLGNERPEEFGISDVLLDALPYPNDYEDFIKDSGAIHLRLGGYAGSGNLTDKLLVPTEHLENALKFQSAIMTVELSDESLRDALSAHSQRDKDHPLFISPVWYSPEIEALACVGSKYYRSPQAVAANLERLSLDCIRRWRRSRYCPDNAYLAITGDVGIDEARRLVEYHFANIAQGEPPFRPLVQVPPAPGYRRITQYLDTQYPEYALMIFIFNTRRAGELDVLGSLLAETPLPRLAAFEEKRSSIVTNIRQDQLDNALFALAFHFEGDPHEAEEDFWKFLDEVKRSPFSPEEVKSAIDEVCSPIHDRYNTLQGQSDALSYFLATGQPWQLIDDKVALLRSITPENVHLAANTSLTSENVTVVCALPIETKP